MKARKSELTLEEQIRKLTGEIADGNLEQVDALHVLIMKKQCRDEVLRQHDHEIYEGADGRWRTKVRMPDGKVKTIRKTNLPDLEDALIDLYEANGAYKSVSATFDDWLAMREERKEISLSSIRRYRSSSKRFFASDTFGDMSIMDVTEDDLESFLERQILSQKLTHKTFGTLRDIVSGTFKYAKKKKWTNISISAFFNDLLLSEAIFAPSRKKSDEDEIFTVEEEKALIRDLSRDATLQHLGVILMMKTGMRVGELSALRPAHIDVSRRRIDVSHTQISYDDEYGHLAVAVSDKPKTACGDRYVYFPDSVLEVLHQIQALRPNSEWLFAYQEDGRRIQSKAFYDALMTACDHVGIRRRSTHKLRKTYITAGLDAGINEAFLQQQVGHSDISTTRRYYYRNRMSEQEKQSEANRIYNM